MKTKLRASAPLREAITPEVVETPMIEEPASNDAAERIKFHITEARKHGQCAIAHVIEAGRELALQKQLLGYGQWNSWCEESLEISRQTADKYIETFARTVGVARSAQRIGLEAKLLKKELEAATVGMEERTVRQAMIEIGVIKPNPNHGGARAGAGRKPKDVAAEMEAITEHEAVLWASAKGALDTLVQLDSEKDVLRRLSDEHLAVVAGILADLSTKAAKTLEKRLSNHVNPVNPV